nr:hypothetical protein [Tanacetum cinerariifolium]
MKKTPILIKEIRASTDAAIRNQGASIKTLEIQIWQMSKVLQERGLRSLPNSTKANPIDQVKSISTTTEADSYPIRCIGSSQYAVSTGQNRTLMRNQVNELMPIIEEGEVVEEFRARNNARMDRKVFGYPSDWDHDKKIHIDCAYNLKFSCMIVLEDMDAYHDEGMGDVIFGKPFWREVGINTRRFEGMITINNEVVHQRLQKTLTHVLELSSCIYLDDRAWGVLNFDSAGVRINLRRTSVTGFLAQSIRSSDAIATDSPYLLVLNTGASQSRQHGKE